MATRDVLTIAEAAKELNLSEQRIHQLLATGDLDGVPLPAGRNRHMPGSPRVFMHSIEQLRRKRTEEQQQKVTQRDAARARRRNTSSTALSAPAVSAEADTGGHVDAAAARAAALEMKVRLDDARDQLHAERARTRKALEIAAGLLDLLRDSTKAGDELDELSDGYAEALIQALAPHAPPEC